MRSVMKTPPHTISQVRESISSQVENQTWPKVSLLIYSQVRSKVNMEGWLQVCLPIKEVLENAEVSS